MILNKSPGLLWGAGGAMMAWELAQQRANQGRCPHWPSKAFAKAFPNGPSDQFYRIIDRAEAAAANRETLLWANGHNTVRL